MKGEAGLLNENSPAIQNNIYVENQVSHIGLG